MGISIIDDGNGNFIIINIVIFNGMDELQMLFNIFFDGVIGCFIFSDGGGSVDVVEGIVIDIVDDGFGNIQIINIVFD